MTPEQRDLARHALGLSSRNSRSYRNHFVTGPGSPDYDEWMAMVAAGEAWRRNGSPLTGGDPVFGLTTAGAKAVRDRGETLDPEDFPT